VNESVSGMRRVIGEMDDSDAGKFLTWKGSEHPW